jgi:UDP-galactopyranose mutase
MHVNWVIVGAGFTGCTLAERIATQLNQKVLLLDRRPHVGGNAYDHYNEHGVLVHRYGPHIFHTNAKRVWDYLSSFTEWRPYYHHVLGVVDGKQIPVPFNINSLYGVFPPRYAEKLEDQLLATYGYGVKVPILKMRESENSDLRLLASYIYDNVFLHYTRKQWELDPDQLDPGVTGRVPVYISRDDRYFQDTWQAMPREGYTVLFQRMLNHKNIRVLLNTDWREIDGEIRYERMIYTGPIDTYFNYSHGDLPYRSLRFDFRTVDTEWHQPVGTVNYPNEHDFTRITEQKYLTGQTLPKSTIVVEYPQAYKPGENEAYYPVPRPQNREHYDLYRRDADQIMNKVLFAGRLADYKYYNMDQAVARALKMFEDEVVPR